MLQNEIAVHWLAKGSQAHQLVFAAVHLEAAVRGEGGVEQAERMRKLEVVGQLDAIASAHSHSRGAPFADAVERENGRRIKWRWEERTGGMALVVVGIDSGARVGPGSPRSMVLAGRSLFLSQPGIAWQKLAKPARRESQIGLQQALELGERFFVENDVIELGRVEARLFQAISDRLCRKSRVVLDSREAFFLRRRDDVAVHDESRSAIVIERG